MVPEHEALAWAETLDPSLPLAGRTFAVKDNIDVTGMPTTAGCPAFAYEPGESAPVVDRLVAAGAILVGKTNLDQFATGLVGTRSPYGIVANSIDPRYVAGGSSSGSAVAVALGLVDFALGTDTAGSGRVPAAFNGIVGLKPTPGLLSTRGVVPACRSLDCVSIFARTVGDAWNVLVASAGFDKGDPYSSAASWAPAAPPGSLRLAVPSVAQLGLTPELADAFARAVDRLSGLVASTIDVDLEPYFAAGNLLYGGGLVAERYASVGAFVDAHPSEVDPVVGRIISTAGLMRADRMAADLDRLRSLRRTVDLLWNEFDALVLPTAPFHPRVAEVLAEPVDVNSRLGRFTTFCNPLSLAALAVPAGLLPTGLPFGVTLYGPPLSDATLARLGAAMGGELAPDMPAASGRIRLAVVGAHLTGEPLNGQLRERNATLVAQTSTAAAYQLFALDTVPPKPGLVRVRSEGRSIDVEVWELGVAEFGDFVAQVPMPLGIGQVELVDGATVAGFICTPDGLRNALDITHHGGWKAYLASR